MTGQLDLLREVTPVAFSREWAMPSGDTFSIAPIYDFVRRWCPSGIESADPFARNTKLARHTNDLNPDTLAEHHMDAADFCHMLAARGVILDAAIFDPPYSPRQISELYKGIGRSVTTADTQNTALYARVRDALDPMIKPGGIVLSFGWNSAGMGKARGYRIEEVLIVCHGGAHNDTICIAERKAA